MCRSVAWAPMDGPGVTCASPTNSTVPAKAAIRNLEVRLDIEVTLPEWEPANRVPEAQRARWSRALAALELHEATQRVNARAAADDARSRILDLDIHPHCQ